MTRAFKYGRRSALCVTTLAALVFTGCSADFNQIAAPVSVAPHVSGSLHGGSQPVAGAKIYLYAAGTGGYGTAARSMLHGGGYTTSGEGGNFNFTADYDCQAGDQVYLVALGGNPGLAADGNAAIGLMAALGPCTSLNANTFIIVNEVTTVAAAFALSGFMTSPATLASSGTPLAQVGVANAFLNAANLADTGAGRARSVTTGGNGAVPYDEINSLANSVASCVNSDGTTSACSTLFTITTPAGGSAPTDTIQALLNLARNPGLGGSTLFDLGSAVAPFQPTLTKAPHDWSIAVTYTNPAPPGDSAYDHGIAVDGLGDVWFLNSATVTVYGPSGAVLSPTGFPVGTNNGLFGIAIDPSNNAWIGAATYVNYMTNNPRIVRMNNAGTILGSYTGGGIATHTSDGIAFDSAGNMWSEGQKTTTPYSLAATKLSSTGAAISPTAGYPSVAGGGIATLGNAVFADTAGNVWGVSEEFSPSGTIIHTTSDCAADNETVTSIDHTGNLWAATYNTTTECSATGALIATYTSPVPNSEATQADGDNRIWIFGEVGPSLGVLDTSGIALSPSGGYQTQANNTEGDYMAIDGSGNIWMPVEGPYVIEFVGLASPVVTPLATAVATGKLGARP